MTAAVVPTLSDSFMTKDRTKITHDSHSDVHNNSYYLPQQRTIFKESSSQQQFPYIVTDEVLCDACSYCQDTCSNPFCHSCQRKANQHTNKEQCNSSSYYTPCQIRRNNHKDSAWLVCGDAIYDATNYIQSHPGGEQSILRKAGGLVDCSVDMAFHSAAAQRIWKRNRIGSVCKCPGKIFGDHVDSKDDQCIIS